MYCIVVVATYSGNLIAFLTVSIPTLPFDSLEEMANSNYRFGSVGGTAFINALRVSLPDTSDCAKIDHFVWPNSSRTQGILLNQNDLNVERVSVTIFIFVVRALDKALWLT